MSKIAKIATSLPSSELTNADLAAQYPDWRMDVVAELTGIYSRRVTLNHETSFDLSVDACASLANDASINLESIDTILYCTQSADYRATGNSLLLHDHLGLSKDVAAFDFDLACSGFIYGLGIADAFIKSGQSSNILLVTAETPTKYIAATDRASRVLFSDGATASLITSAEVSEPGTVLASKLCTYGSGYRYAYAPYGGARSPSNPGSTEQANGQPTAIMDGTDLWQIVGQLVPGHVEDFLASNGYCMEDIDLVVFHQASKLILDRLSKLMALPAEKVYRCLESVGNLSSSSIPYALCEAISKGAISSGDTVLLCGFGSGISYGSAIVQY